MTESTGDRRKRLGELHHSISTAGSKNDLIDAIEDALGVSAPVGDPATLEGLGKTYRRQIDDVGRLGERVGKVARKGLPDVWAGDTSVLASDAVAAAGRETTRMSDAFEGGGKALIRLADSIKDAQKQDGDGRAKLREARTMLGGKDGFFDDWHEDDDEEAERLKARSVASAGADLLHKAAITADDAARAAARDLNKWASQARAGKLDGADGLTAVDRLALADTSNVDGDPEMNEILSANDLERSSRAMDRLSAADRGRMDQLMANASTPQEKAYILKALASGHDVNEVEKFAGKIHGKDPAWLEDHLAPITTQTDSMVNEGKNSDGSNRNKDDQTFRSQGWTQGGNGRESTCVASSTVTARAMVDPVYALSLTGGPSGQEDDPAAFRRRLVDEQHRVHVEGDGGDNWTGMDLEGKTEVVNKEISPQTGSKYELREVRDADARRNVLPDIEKAVAEGKPVPIGVEGYNAKGERSGHAMTIIGQEGDKLEIYNPWGTTTWVSEDDFINGGMAKASNNSMPNAYAVHIPQD
ncbi:peptidoglycan-binding protein [Streptomyces sp. NPDC006314]|uniref:peptidoglycan-binding protein n=1 Tax=Streptomyces sp. NPDC006314 TaxID=3154475 RepID=UPI0033ADC7E9